MYIRLSFDVIQQSVCGKDPSSFLARERNNRAAKIMFRPPMLAKDWHGITGSSSDTPVLVQPKLDGVRMLALVLPGGRGVRLFSRTGGSFDHLAGVVFSGECLKAVASGHTLAPGTLLDGELYVHGVGFQSIVSAVKDRALSGPLVPRLMYHVYDAILPGAAGASAPYAVRHAAIAAVVERAGPSCRLTLVPTVSTRMSDVEAQHDRWTGQGYEGVMVRDPDAPYQSGRRSPSLLKYKRFQDAEFVIVGHEEATGKDRGTVVFVCAAATKYKNKTFRVRPTGTRAERAAMLRDAPALLGKRITVRFQGLTDCGLPRFPVGVALRDYE